MIVRLLKTLSMLAIFCAIAPSTSLATPLKIKPVAATASQTYSGSSPNNVFDGNTATGWGAGTFAPAWIQLDLGRTYPIRQIRMLTGQAPDGQTTHKVLVGTDPENLRLARTLSGHTANAQWIGFVDDSQTLGNVRYVRILTESSPSWIAWNEVEVYQGLEYVANFRDGLDPDWPNTLNATTANGANLVFVDALNAQKQPDTEALRQKLAKARDLGVKAIIDLNNYLFHPQTEYLITSADDPTCDYGCRWQRVVNVVNQNDLRSVVAAFYLRDEPYLRALHGNGDISRFRADLTTMAQNIRAAFSGIPIAVIMSVPELNTLSSSFDFYYGMFDWLGFDCYGDFSHCEADPQKASNTEIHYRLRQRLRSDQRLIAVPWAYANRSELGSTPQAQRAMENLRVSDISYWHKEVLDDPRIVAIFPFMWSNYKDALYDIIGTVQLPWVKERLYQLAKSFLPDANKRVYPILTFASSSWEAGLSFAAFDRNVSDGWNAGGYATQSLYAFLPGNNRVARIVLTVGQSPAGATTHEIYGLSPKGAWFPVAKLQGYTQHGQMITWQAPFYLNVTAFEIRTTQSPSWVAWQDIAFFDN